MFRLIFLTLILFFVLLTIYGDGEGRRVAAAPGPAARVVESLPLTAEPQPEIIQVVEQTPTRSQPFPGPELRPSPEFEDSAPAAASAAEATGDVLFVTGNSVNFRAGPTTSDRVIGALSRGTQVTPIGALDGDWIQIRDDRGRAGFMSAQFLSPDRP